MNSIEPLLVERESDTAWNYIRRTNDQWTTCLSFVRWTREESRRTTDRDRERERSRPTDVPGNAVAQRDTTDSYAHPKLSGSWRTARTCRPAGRCACLYEGSRLPATAALVYPSGIVRRWEKSVPRTPRTTAPNGGGNVLQLRIKFFSPVRPLLHPWFVNFIELFASFGLWYFSSLPWSDDLFRRIAIFVTRWKKKRKKKKIRQIFLQRFTRLYVCFEITSFENRRSPKWIFSGTNRRMETCCWHKPMRTLYNVFFCCRSREGVQSFYYKFLWSIM